MSSTEPVRVYWKCHSAGFIYYNYNNGYIIRYGEEGLQHELDTQKIKYFT